jgi:predicted hydrocarbon binding protein
VTEQLDFEQQWLAKFADCLDAAAGEDLRRAVMEGSEALSSQSSREEVVAWSRAAMARLEALLPDEHTRCEIMTGCACQYPKAQLAEIRRAYQETGDVELAHQMLQVQFESFLRETLELQEAMIDEVIGRGWGSAGVKQGSTIIATKIPKSGYLLEYLQEEDSQRRRQIYCHCPRVRDAVTMQEQLPLTYCYCGAGFYKGIWEEILQQPVEVEVRESVLQGGDVCTIAIHLPGE